VPKIRTGSTKETKNTEQSNPKINEQSPSPSLLRIENTEKTLDKMTHSIKTPQ
jgi:hypothetical protein